MKPLQWQTVVRQLSQQSSADWTQAAGIPPSPLPHPTPISLCTKVVNTFEAAAAASCDSHKHTHTGHCWCPINSSESSFQIYERGPRSKLEFSFSSAPGGIIRTDSLFHFSCWMKKYKKTRQKKALSPTPNPNPFRLETAVCVTDAHADQKPTHSS